MVLHAFFPSRFRLMHLAYLCLALGATISPLVTTPFVFDSISESIATQHRVVQKREAPLDQRAAQALFVKPTSNSSDGIIEYNGTLPIVSTTSRPKKLVYSWL